MEKSDNTPGSVGELLQSARNEKKVTIEQAHHATKISIEVLKRIEQDDFDTFQSDLYLKNFIRNYARYLDMDVAVVLEALERQRGVSRAGGGTVWDIEETVVEEKLKSPKIFKRFILPAMLIIIIVLSILLIRERRRARDLTLLDAAGYLRAETVSAESGGR